MAACDASLGPLTPFAPHVNSVHMTTGLAERILNTTRDLYLEEGEAGVSMRKVAERVGVTAPAIYRHFPNKTALLHEIVAEGFQVFAGYLHRALEGTSPVERLRLTGEAFAQFAADHPEYYRMMFLAPRDFGGGKSGEALERRNMATFQFLLDRVRECMDCGALRRDDPEKVALAIFSMSHGIMSLYMAGSRFIPDAETLKRLRLELNLRLFRGLFADGPETDPKS